MYLFLGDECSQKLFIILQEHNQAHKQENNQQQQKKAENNGNEIPEGQDGTWIS